MTSNSGIKCCLTLIGWVVFFAVGALATSYAALVLRTMWEWFVVPEGYTTLTLNFSIGICLIVSFLKVQSSELINTDDEDKKPSLQTAFTKLIAYLVFISLSWGTAAIWHFWLLG
jgi:hypothetical protein